MHTQLRGHASFPRRGLLCLLLSWSLKGWLAGSPCCMLLSLLLGRDHLALSQPISAIALPGRRLTMFWVGVMGIWVLTAAFTMWNRRVMTVAGRKRELRKISGGSVGRPGTDGFSGTSPHRAWPGTHPQGVLEEVRVLGPTFLPHCCFFSFSWVRETSSGASSHSSLLPPTWGGA